MAKNILSKLASAYVWGNIIAVLIVITFLCIGVRYGMQSYTRHGESIVVPNLVNMQFDDAEDKLAELGLQIVVSDTGYIKTLPPDCILDQSPINGKRVKGGRVIYVTINSAGSPTLVVPDIVDNGSYRESSAKLAAMGFKLGEPEWIPGEKDWIYGLKVAGKSIKAGDRISTESKLVMVVGDGTRNIADSLMFSNPAIEYEDAPVDEQEYEYEIVEVPIDAEGEEIVPQSQAPATSVAE
jgi:beta-lactam-binding protein with PASTA domain